MRARRDIQLASYRNHMSIEARVMSEMIRRDILPVAIAFSRSLAEALNQKRLAVPIPPTLPCLAETELLRQVSEFTDALYQRVGALDAALSEEERIEDDWQARAHFCRDHVHPAMGLARECADALERIVSKSAWPYPSLGHIINRV